MKRVVVSILFSVLAVAALAQTGPFASLFEGKQSTKLKGLSLQATLASACYSPGERIEVTLTFRNEGRKPLSFQRDVHPVLLWPTASGLRLIPALGTPPPGHATASDAGILPLEPGETWTAVYGFTPQADSFTGPRQVVKVGVALSDRYDEPEPGVHKQALNGILLTPPMTLILGPRDVPSAEGPKNYTVEVDLDPEVRTEVASFLDAVPDGFQGSKAYLGSPLTLGPRLIKRLLKIDRNLKKLGKEVKVITLLGPSGGSDFRQYEGESLEAVAGSTAFRYVMSLVQGGEIRLADAEEKRRFYSAYPLFLRREEPLVVVTKDKITLGLILVHDKISLAEIVSDLPKAG